MHEIYVNQADIYNNTQRTPNVVSVITGYLLILVRWQQWLHPK